jgi:hypothetical protein
MRTTLTLDDDLAVRVKQIARERGVSFKEALNGLLRAGLAKADGAARPFKLRTHPMGLRPGINMDKALRLVGELEDAETIRKLERRK